MTKEQEVLKDLKQVKLEELEEAIKAVDKQEQEEAIKALKEHKEEIDKKYLKARYSKAIEKVLSMLEEKDKQIHKLKKHNDRLLKKLRNRVKEVKKLEKYSLYKEEFSRLNKQLLDKDKIIDLMTERVFLTEEEWKEIQGKKIYNVIEKDISKQIKQYFENKAKELLNK